MKINEIILKELFYQYMSSPYWYDARNKDIVSCIEKYNNFTDIDSTISPRNYIFLDTMLTYYATFALPAKTYMIVSACVIKNISNKKYVLSKNDLINDSAESILRIHVVQDTIIYKSEIYKMQDLNDKGYMFNLSTALKNHEFNAIKFISTVPSFLFEKLGYFNIDPFLFSDPNEEWSYDNTNAEYI